MDWIKESKYPQLAIVNFIILTFLGFLLRFMQLYPLPGFNYQYLLHAHSHFAFAGWMFFSIAILITHSLASVTNFRPYKTVFIFALISAFGMLVTFSLQGYRFASIAFSTLFILVTYWFTYLVLRKNGLGEMCSASGKFIKGGLFYLCLSSLGPFALAPIIISGFGNTPLYQNAIYFYLHFQMNGFMLLTALGLFASGYLSIKLNKSSRVWLALFIYSTIPLFLIFVLWTKPATWVWIVALSASVVNLVSWIKLGMHFKEDLKELPFLVKGSLLAITFKTAIQVVICFPIIGEWAFLNRNLIIGYVHLLTLGCVVPLILDQFIRRNFLSGKYLLTVNWFYITAVVLYLVLLFTQPLLSLLLILIPHYPLLLLVLSAIFLFVGVLYFLQTRSDSSVSA